MKKGAGCREKGEGIGGGMGGGCKLTRGKVMGKLYSLTRSAVLGTN